LRRGENGRWKNRKTWRDPPPSLFFGSVDSRRVGAQFLRSVDSSRVEIVQNECVARALGSVDSREVADAILRSVDSGRVRGEKTDFVFSVHAQL
jgi:hypothetical protein